MESRGERCQLPNTQTNDLKRETRRGLLYRLYLKNGSGAIVGRADFDAEEKEQSLVVAAAIFDDCSDIASGYELWSQDDLVLPLGQPAPPPETADLPERQQRLILATEMALYGGDWIIRESTKLAEKIERFGGLSTDAFRTDPATDSAYQPALTAGSADTVEGFIAGIESPALRDLAKHWSEARGGKPMPSWSDLSSSALSPHLKLLWGYQFDRRKSEFTGRLAGTHIKRWLGPNFCNAKLSDIHPPHIVMEAHAFLAKVVTTPGVGLCSGRLFTIGGHTITGERLALPLATNETSADGILGASDFIYPSVSGQVELIHENIQWCTLPDSGSGS